MTLDVGERLMSITDLSEMLGVPIHTLYRWRHKGEGPVGYRIGRHVKYRRATVEAWLETQTDKALGRTREVQRSNAGRTSEAGVYPSPTSPSSSSVHTTKAEAEVDCAFGDVAAPNVSRPSCPANKIKIADELICPARARQPVREETRWPPSCTPEGEA